MIRVARSLACLCLAFILGFVSVDAEAAITNLVDWQIVEDPAHPNFSSSVTGSNRVGLFAADGPIPSGTDIGFQSIFGGSPSSATGGHFFRANQSFSLAVDYEMSFGGTPSGALAIGFGAGEDSNGTNSAGVIVFTNNGTSEASAGASRTGDVPAIAPIGLFPSLTGAMFVSYESSSGTVNVGTGAKGAMSPTSTTFFAGVANQWNGSDLFPSVFLRSDDVLGQGWTSGTAAVEFSNFRILSGTAVAVPEPGGCLILVAAGLIVFSLRWHHRSIMTQQ